MCSRPSKAAFSSLKLLEQAAGEAVAVIPPPLVDQLGAGGRGAGTISIFMRAERDAGRRAIRAAVPAKKRRRSRLSSCRPKPAEQARRATL